MIIKISLEAFRAFPFHFCSAVSAREAPFSRGHSGASALPYNRSFHKPSQLKQSYLLSGSITCPDVPDAVPDHLHLTLQPLISLTFTSTLWLSSDFSTLELNSWLRAIMRSIRPLIGPLWTIIKNPMTLHFSPPIILKMLKRQPRTPIPIGQLPNILLILNPSLCIPLWITPSIRYLHNLLHFRQWSLKHFIPFPKFKELIFLILTGTIIFYMFYYDLFLRDSLVWFYD